MSTAKNKINDYEMKNSYTTEKLASENFMTEVKPVFVEKKLFLFREKSLFIAHSGSFGQSET